MFFVVLCFFFLLKNEELALEFALECGLILVDVGLCHAVVDLFELAAAVVVFSGWL